MTDQDEGEGVAVVAVATAVAGGCGKIAAAREAEAGWMRLDEDAAATGGQRAAGKRTFPSVQPPARSELWFHSALSNLFSPRWSDRVPALDDELCSSLRPVLTRWLRIFVICTGFWITADHGLRSAS